MTTMTLEQVRDKLRKTAKFERDAHMPSNAKAWDEMADAVDAHLAKGAQEWRPIDTAPRDATAILVMRNDWPGCKNGVAEECNGHNTYVAQWWSEMRTGQGAWVCYMDFPSEPICPVEPTHWMPLPAAPMLSQRWEVE